MVNQLLALSLAGVLSLTGCGLGNLPTEEVPASLQKSAVATAVYPDYPQFVNYQDYMPIQEKGMGDEEYSKRFDEAWERYQADNKSYQEKVQAIQTGTVSPAFQKSIGNFAQDSLGQLLSQKPDSNQIYSPINLYVALSVLAQITDGDTQKEVLTVLGAENGAELGPQCQKLWNQLYLDDGIGKRLLANSLWLRKDFPFHEDLIQNLARQYYASTYEVIMGPSADQAMQDWVNQQTGNTLAEQAKGIETQSDTAMVLLSTLYFYDQWSKPFQEAKTAPDTFTKADGGKITCDFMHGSWSGTYLKTDAYLAASRAFERGGGMLFLLPNEGTSLTNLTKNGTLNSLFDGSVYNGANSQFGEIQLSVPKFDLTATQDWKEDLESLGIRKAFDEKTADFTPLTDQPRMYLDKVQQVTRVKIDEVGCTASSYVEMAIGAGSAMPSGICELNLDRPFLFVIFSEENIPLFIGAVNDPS